jgi:DNA (cytosine-5)-methyltransferase 1
MKYKLASLFSGCGGMDLGAEGGFSFLEKNYKKHPIETVYAMDFDEKAASIYNLNFEKKLQVIDIRNLDSSKIPNHDILTGGFPCQSFSVLAQNPKRLGYNDEKGMLFFEMCRILKEKSPKVFIAENVKGILSANKKQAFPLILGEFEKCGYHVKYALMNASHFGVPQKRERVFIVGFKSLEDYENFSFPTATHTNSFEPLSKILLPTQEIEEKFYFSQKAVDGMLNTKNSKIMNKGRAQNIDLPCNTVASHLAKVSLNSTDPVLFEDGRYRMFTPREVARIQSFPDKFKLVESKTINYRGLGNAVAPVMMWHITSSVIKALELNISNVFDSENKPNKFQNKSYINHSLNTDLNAITM